jgi:adenosylcobyric acid synthase
MLGGTISDPGGIEGPPRTVRGLGLLDVDTVMTGDKTLREVSGVLLGVHALGGAHGAGSGGQGGGVGADGSGVDMQVPGAGAHGVGAGVEVTGEPAGVGAVAFAGYEMHIGSTTGPGASRPFLRLSDGSTDGAVSADGRVAGCYVHGLFGVTAARAALVSAIGATPSHDDHAARVDTALDEIASVLESCLDISALAAIAGL